MRSWPRRFQSSRCSRRRACLFGSRAYSGPVRTRSASAPSGTSRTGTGSAERSRASRSFLTPTIAPVTAGGESTKRSAAGVTLGASRARISSRASRCPNGGVRRKSSGSSFGGEREEPLLFAPLQRAVLELQRRDGADGERPLDELGRMVRDPAVVHFAVAGQLLD